MTRTGGWLRRLADRIDPPAPVAISPLEARAEYWVRDVEASMGPRHHDYKRRLVANRLTKEFPDVRGRAIAQAIEWAIPRVKG